MLVLVLGAIYTKRAINRRLATKQLHARITGDADELPIHVLLSSGDGDAESEIIVPVRVMDFAPQSQGGVLQRPMSQQRLQQL